MRWIDLVPRVPRWSTRPSGLIVPTQIPGTDVSEAGQALPPGVTAPEPDLVVFGQLPSSFEQMRVFMSEEALGLPESTPEDLQTLVSQLSFEICFLALAQLAAHVTHMRGNAEAQLELAQLIFGEEQLVARIRRMSREVEGNLEVFPEQHTTALQRLLVLHAKDVAIGPEVGDREQLIFNRAFTATSALTAEEHLGGAPADSEARTRWLAYLIQNGTYNRTSGHLESMIRQHVLFQDIAAEEEVRSHRDYCDVDGWLVDDLGFSLAEQFALGFGVFGGAKTLDESIEIRERSLLGPDYVAELARRLGRDPDRAHELLSADRDWYRAEFGRGEQTPVRAAWERTAFEVRPLLRLADGRLLLVSPRAIESWLGDGFYHRALAAARRRGEVDRFQRFYGLLVEKYAVRLLRHVHPEPRPPGSGRVFGDQDYGEGSKSPDIAVDCGRDLVLFEVTSGRFTLHTLLEGSVDAAVSDLGRLLFNKGAQLSRRIDDLLAGEWAPEGVDIEHVDRIWPVLITADVLQNELLWDEINERLQDKLNQPKVERLTLLDLDDLEELAALVERGHGLADIIRRKATGQYAQLDFRRFVAETPDLPAEIRLSLLGDRWEEEMRRAIRALGFSVDEEEITRIRAEAEAEGETRADG